jgi:sugar phosphate isomerase/epimerase
MEMDLGWVVAAGHNPLKYFQRYPGRFPLWHLKDMKDNEPVSTEFGEGRLDISLMLLNAKQSGMKYFFVEQEEYANNPFESIKQNYAYLMHMNS